MRTTLTLTLAVTYELNGADVRDLEDNLLALAALANNNGWLADGTDAEVVIANPSVARSA